MKALDIPLPLATRISYTQYHKLPEHWRPSDIAILSSRPLGLRQIYEGSPGLKGNFYKLLNTIPKMSITKTLNAIAFDWNHIILFM